jgi:hypothetical protein
MNIYNKYWKIFEIDVYKIIYGNLEKVSFQTIYTCVYKMCITEESIKKFKYDLDNLLFIYREKLSDDIINHLNTVCLYYTTKKAPIKKIKTLWLSKKKINKNINYLPEQTTDSFISLLPFSDILISID